MLFITSMQLSSLSLRYYLGSNLRHIEEETEHRTESDGSNTVIKTKLPPTKTIMRQKFYFLALAGLTLVSLFRFPHFVFQKQSWAKFSTLLCIIGLNLLPCLEYFLSHLRLRQKRLNAPEETPAEISFFNTFYFIPFQLISCYIHSLFHYREELMTFTHHSIVYNYEVIVFPILLVLLVTFAIHLFKHGLEQLYISGKMQISDFERKNHIYKQQAQEAQERKVAYHRGKADGFVSFTRRHVPEQQHRSQDSFANRYEHEEDLAQYSLCGEITTISKLDTQAPPPQGIRETATRDFQIDDSLLQMIEKEMSTKQDMYSNIALPPPEDFLPVRTVMNHYSSLLDPLSSFS